MRLLAVILVAAAALPGAASAGWVPIHPTTRFAECGTPSTVGSFGRIGRGVAVGPLVLPFDDGGRAARQTFEPGFPTRVVIRGRAPRKAELTLRGYRCETGEPLRFWYRSEPLRFPNGFPTTDSELQQRGDTVVRFPATKKLRGVYAGYMLFWAEGDWRLVLSRGGTTIGAAVVRVSASPAS